VKDRPAHPLNTEDEMSIWTVELKDGRKLTVRNARVYSAGGAIHFDRLVPLPGGGVAPRGLASINAEIVVMYRDDEEVSIE